MESGAFWGCWFGCSSSVVQQTSSMHYSDGRSANTVKLTAGGSVDGHFYTSDGTVTVIHKFVQRRQWLDQLGHDLPGRRQWPDLSA